MDLMEEQWDEISLEGILSFSFGTFFNVIPKLVLISWTFSVLNWNMWLIFIPLFMISECISFKINEDLKEEGIKYYGKRLFTSIQVMFGYSGWKGTIFSAFLMAIVVQLVLMIIMVSLLLTVIVPCTIWAVACIWIGAVGSTRISASPVYILGLAALGMFMYLGLAALGTF